MLPKKCHNYEALSKNYLMSGKRYITLLDTVVFTVWSWSTRFAQACWFEYMG